MKLFQRLELVAVTAGAAIAVMFSTACVALGASKLDGLWEAEQTCSGALTVPGSDIRIPNRTLPGFDLRRDVWITNGILLFVRRGDIPLDPYIEFRGDFRNTTKARIIGKPILAEWKWPYKYIYQGKITSEPFVLTGKLWRIGGSRAKKRPIQECVIRFIRVPQTRELALRSNLNTAEVFGTVANGYCKGQDDRANQDYVEAIQLYPNNAVEAFYNRGNLYRSKGQYDRAIRDGNQAIRLNPNHADAFCNRGFAYSAKGDLDRATVDFAQALKLNPQFESTMKELGILKLVKPDIKRDRSIQDLASAVLLNR